MAFVRQGKNVDGARASAGAVTDGINDIENLNAEYDVLNLESPNFAAGFFGSTQEITANDHLGIYTSLSALKAAAPSQWAAFRAALRKART